jgi:predicted Zn-dependent peptidase
LSTVFYEQETANIVRERRKKKQSINPFYSWLIVTQSNMAIRIISMQVLNGLLGGFSHSKLFTNVREKESLAYYANSRFDTFTGFLKISAGIDAGQRSKALTIIRAQVRALAQGDISDSELDQTKIC